MTPKFYLKKLLKDYMQNPPEYASIESQINAGLARIYENYARWKRIGIDADLQKKTFLLARREGYGFIGYFSFDPEVWPQDGSDFVAMSMRTALLIAHSDDPGRAFEHYKKTANGDAE